MLHNLNIRKVLSSKNWAPVLQMYGMGRFNDIWKSSVEKYFLADTAVPDLGMDSIISIYLKICEIVSSENVWDKRENVSEIEEISALEKYLMQIPNHLCDGIALASGRKGSVEIKEKLDLPIFGIVSVRRTGWTRVIPAFYPGIPGSERVETVAEHSIKTAILAACLAPDNRLEAFEMGLCHDMAESKVGDLTPQQMPDREVKHRLEAEAFEKMISAFPDNIASKFRLRFMNYLENQTNLAHIVHMADKLDMALQAMSYERLFHIDLQEFLDSASKEIWEDYGRVNR